MTLKLSEVKICVIVLLLRAVRLMLAFGEPPGVGSDVRDDPSEW